MSLMKCHRCERAVDTDDDPDSLYVLEDKCVCWDCRTPEDEKYLEMAQPVAPYYRRQQ